LSVDSPILLTLDGPAAGAEDLVAHAASALEDRYRLFGELGRGAGGSVAVLARDVVSRGLVALRIRLLSDRPDTVHVAVLKRLDASLPELTGACPSCSEALQSWTPFCPFCAADLSRVAICRSGRTREELLDLVRRASTGRYEVLGETDRLGGGGLVYVGRDLGSGRLVAMRLSETAGTSDRRSSGERRSGQDRRERKRRTRTDPAPREQRAASRPKYTLDLTELVNPLADASP
jgi:hypothetical protein